MRVVIAGASGLIGRELVQFCLSDDDVGMLFILVRKHLDMSHEKLHQIIINYDDISENDLPDNIDVLFNCLGTTIKNAGSEENFIKVDFNYVVELATIAHLKKVKKFISVSSMGAKLHSKTLYYRVKGMKEDFLMNDSHLENVFIVRPSLLLGKRKEFRFGEFIGKILMTALDILFVGNLKKYRAIEAKTVAKAMLNLSKMNESGKKIILSDALETLANATM
ncbi:MAG: hypothetical protein CL840_02695 [Crocinitomicaceae bacterium]|nr:hypothetical protein [Crocinitomicaceae bacterium]|tara:strand:- start:14469 stop:15134 length:666 start_codon:yes stop_codon:yes gene_type:complete